MQQELSNIIEGIFDDEIHADTFLLGKGWINIVSHDYSTKLLGFSEDILKLELPIVDSPTTLRTDNDDEIIIEINQDYLNHIKMYFWCPPSRLGTMALESIHH